MLLFVGVLFSYTNTISAQANSTINFQGKISDITDGTNVDSTSTVCVISGASNDTCDFRVRIYDAPSAGTMLFEETHSNVEIGESNGVFNLSLNSVCNDWVGGCAGSGITWGADSTIYIQIEFDPSGNGDFAEGETFSRKELKSVPYAYYADNVSAINGLGVNGLVQLQPSSAQTATGSTSLIWLNETGGGTPNLLELEVGGTNVFTVENDGSTSVGTSTSTAYLTIAGSTTSQASLRLMSSGGVDPSASNSGDLWWNGTNLYFNDGTTNIDILGLGGDGPKFTDGGTATYLTQTADDFVIGGATLSSSVFSIDVSTGEHFLGSNGLVNPELVFENANSSVARIGYNSNNNFQIYNGANDLRVGINKAIAEYELDVNGTIQVSEDILTDTPTVNNTTSDTTETYVGTFPTWITREVSSTNAVLGRKITTDASGNVYVAGYFNNDVNFGLGPWTASGWDYFVLKYNSTGTLLWADRENGGGGDVFGTDIAVDISGNVYFVGTFSGGSVNFSGSLWTPTGGNDYVIVKYDSSGNLLWADTENVGSTGSSGVVSVDTDSFGNVYLGGSFSGTVDFGSGSALVSSATNYFVLKYDSSGAVQWVKTEAGGTGSTDGYMDVDAAGNVYVSGALQGTVEFVLGDPKTSIGTSDMFVLKLNTSGVVQWVEVVAGGDITVFSVVVDSTGSVYTSGYFTGTVNFGGGSWPATGDDYFVSKYNTSGVFQWADREDGGGGDVNVNDINVDSNDNLYVTGLFDNTQVNFGEGLWTPSGWNYFLIKYNSAGVFQWGHQEAGGTGSSNGRGVSVTTDGEVYVTGYMDGTINFGITTYSTPDVDYFVIKFEDQYEGETTYDYEYTGSDIGAYDNAFANTYTYGLVTRGVSVFESVINAEGDILPSAPTLNTTTGDVVTFTSEGVNYEWTAVYGTAGASLEITKDVYEDPTTKDVFLVGQFRNTIDADPGAGTATLTSNGNADFFIIKYNSSGAYQWAVSVGGTNDEDALFVRQKSNGNVVVLGTPNIGTVDYDGTGGTDSISGLAGQIFITEYTSAGAYVGTFMIGGLGTIFPMSFELDSDDNYYFGGNFTTGSTLDFDNSGGTDAFSLIGNRDAFLTKYNANGSYGWTRRWGASAQEHRFSDIELDNTNDIIYLTGNLRGTVDVDGTTGGTNTKISSGASDILISTYTFSGNYGTSIQIGGGGNEDEGFGIALDSNNNIYLYSVFSGTADFNPGAGTDNRSATPKSGALTMFDSSFNYINTRNFGGTLAGTHIMNTTNPGRISIDDNDAILLSGEYTGLLDFEPAITSNSHTSLGSSDVYLIKFLDINTFAWSYSFGGTTAELLYGMYSQTDNAMFMAGSWTGTVDFNPTPGADSRVFAGTTADGFVTKVLTRELIGKNSRIILSSGLPLIVSSNESAQEVTVIGCFDIACSSSITTSYSGTGGPVGGNDLPVIIRSNGLPIIGYYEITGQDLEAIDCTTSTCSAGTLRTIDAAAAGLYITIWNATNTGLPNFGYTLAANTHSFRNNCTNVTCATPGTSSALGTNPAGNEGHYPRAVMRPSDLPFVFAIDQTNEELEAINCTNDLCSTFEATKVLDDGGDGPGGVQISGDVEATLSSDGYPIAIYRDITNQSIKLVRCLDLACNTYDVSTIIDTANLLGTTGFGLALKGNGSPVISYHDATEGTLNVYECASSECTTGVNYQLTDGTYDEGEYSSIVRVPGASDRFLISYYDATNEELKMYDFNKTYTGGGINLGSSTNFFNNLYTANIFSKNASISNFDVAEEYKVEDESIEAGDVVRFKKDATDQLIVERTDKAYDGEVIGVISTEPGLYLKNWEENDGRGRPVALVGRVPVKVTDENGRIRRGDYLVASSTPGYAMKATEGGVIIGRAMEDYGTENDSNVEKGKIMMYVDLGYMEKDVLDNRESVEESINILSYGMQNGDNLFELVEEVDRSELKINAEVVVKKSLAAERYRSTGGDFIVEVVGEGGFKVLGEGDEVLFGVDSKGKISLREGEGGSIGSVDMKVGEKEIRVLNSSVTDSSKIFVRPDKAIVYGVKEQFDKEGFTIEVSEPLTEDVRFNYWIIN